MAVVGNRSPRQSQCAYVAVLIAVFDKYFRDPPTLVQSLGPFVSFLIPCDTRKCCVGGVITKKV